MQLLVRLHLAGFYWGDCSLSNTLFRLDAGALEAYLVDTETSEQHTSLSDGQRSYDVELAREHVAGELMDLQAGDLLPPDLDPITLADSIPSRYRALWDELAHEEALRADEQRYRVANRLRRLNELGFDAEEVELVSSGGGTAKRNSLGDTTFAFPQERKEPLNDARHVRNAIARFDQVEGVSEAERGQAWKRIKAAAMKHGVEVEAGS